MNKQSWLLNLSLLKTHPAFRAVFLARFISIVSLGLLGVAVPGADPDDDTFYLAGGAFGDADRRRDVCWPDGRRCAGGSL